MTISTEVTRKQYNGNDVTTEFSFPYKFLADGDLTVILTDSSGLDTTLTLSTHYTVTGAGVDAGGTVTMITPPATGERLTIVRELDLVQETDYISGDSFPSESHETALDRLTMIAQQLRELVGRSVILPASTTYSDVVLENPTALAFIRWNSDGTALESVGVALGAGDLLSSNNLSDVDSAAIARVNLGLEIGADVQAYDATIVVDADIGVTVQAYDADILKADISDNLTVGYPTDSETLVSDTITPDLTAEWLKYREVEGTVTINEPTDGGKGGCIILLNVTGAGPYTITLGTNCYPVGTLPDLVTTLKYECRVIKHTDLITSVEVIEIVGA